jgi:LysM repeat protein
MRARNWAILIMVNVIVSAAVVLTILFIWNRAQGSATVTPTPVSIPLISEEVESTPPPSPAVSPTPSEPLLYIVQEGDSLGVIAQTHGVSIGDLIAANKLTDPNVLHVGQTLTIPIGSLSTPDSSTEPLLEPSPAVTLLPTLTPSSPPLIEIGQVLGSGDPAAEVVIVRNRGGVASLEGWTISAVDGDTFTFPALTLFTDVQVRVYSTVGISTPSELYWGRTEPAWTGGEMITLRNAAGNVVDTYIVP